MSVRLELFGFPRVYWNSQADTPPLNKPALLLLFLAYRGDWVSRSELAFLFRADEPEKAALSHLRTLIHRTKKYPWASSLEASKTHLRWQVETDVQAFQEAFQNKDWQTALESFKGELLDGYSADDVAAYSAWLELERDALALRMITVTQKRIEAFELEGKLEEAIRLAKDLCRREPFDEDFLQLQLRLLHKDQRTKEAFQVYEVFCRQLKNELDAEALESTQALVDSFKTQVQKPVEQKIVKHNLPAQTTRFIGRKLELEMIAEKFSAEDCRLLTLVGLGGTGKTRLSLEFARTQVDNFIDGVFFVPLAGVLTRDALLSAVAESMGFMFSGSDALQDQLLAYLETKQTLLVLDNFEQLKAEAMLLESMLRTCAKLKVLVTSREALELQSEWLIDLYGLSYPEKNINPETFEAVKLFLNRAERVAPFLVKTEEVLASIAEITRFVEGMPLAIELAASWARSLSPQDIAKTLHNNLDMLSSSYQNLLGRQRSMTTVFDTSFEQLSEFEQNTFEKLAIFESSFDLEAAEQVTGAHLVLLMNLINRSLVRRNETGRYSIHELLRQYLATRRNPEDELGLEDIYSEHYLQRLAVNIQTRPGGKPQKSLAHLIQDLDNIRKAYQLASKNKNWSVLLEAHAGLRALMARTGRWQEIANIYEVLLDELSKAEQDPKSQRLKLLTEMSLNYANWFLKQNTYEIAKNYYLKLLEDETEPGMQIELLFHTAHYDESHGRFDEGEAGYLSALEKARELGDTNWQGVILQRLTDTPWLKGDYAQAAHNAREWLKLSEATGETTYIVEASLALHNRLTMIGATEANSDALLKKAWQYKDDVNLKTKALIYQGFGLHNAYLKDYQSSSKNLAEALRLFLQTSDKRTAALVAASLGRVLKEEERFDEAIEAIHQSMDLFAFAAMQYGYLAEVAQHRGDLLLAKNYLVKALNAYLRNTSPVMVLLNTFICLALIYQHDDMEQTALDLAAFVYHHKGATALQKEQIETMFGQLKSPSTLASKSIESLITEQIEQLKTSLI